MVQTVLCRERTARSLDDGRPAQRFNSGTALCAPASCSSMRFRVLLLLLGSGAEPKSFLCLLTLDRSFRCLLWLELMSSTRRPTSLANHQQCRSPAKKTVSRPGLLIRRPWSLAGCDRGPSQHPLPMQYPTVWKRAPNSGVDYITRGAAISYHMRTMIHVLRSRQIGMNRPQASTGDGSEELPVQICTVVNMIYYHFADVSRRPL